MAIDLPTITQKIVVDTSQFSAAVSAGQGMSSGLGGVFSTIGSNLTKFVSLPIAALGGLAIAASIDVGKGMNEIARQTGATGKELESLNTSFKNVGRDTPTSLSAVGTAIADVHQRTGLLGAPLEILTKRFLDLERITGQQLNFNQLQMAMSSFGITAEQMPGILDEIYRATAATGLPIESLVRILQLGGPAIRQFGLSIGEAAGFLGLLEQAGVPANTVLVSLRREVQQAAKEGVPAEQFLRQTVDRIHDLIAAGNTAEAHALANKIFGPRGQNLVEALTNGRISIDQIHNSLATVGPGIEEVANRTMTFKERMAEMKNAAEIAISPIGEVIIPQLQKAVETASPYVEDFLKKIGDAAVPVTIAGAALVTLGPAFQAIGALVTILGGPLTLIVGLLVGLGLAAIYLYQNFEPVTDLFDNLGSVFMDTFNVVKEFFNEATTGDKTTASVERLADKMGGLPGFAIKALVWFRDVFWPGLQTVWNSIYNAFWAVVNWVEKNWPKAVKIFWTTVDVISTIADAVRQVWNAAKPVLDALGAVFLWLWHNIVEPLINWWIEHWDDIKKSAEDLWNKLSPIFERLGKLFKIFGVAVAIMVAPIIGALVTLRWIWTSFGEYIVTFLVDVLGGIIDWVSGIIDVIAGLIDFVAAVFTGDWAGAWQAIQDIFWGFVEGFYGIFEMLIAPIVAIGSLLWDYLGPVFEAAWSWITDVVMTAWNVILTVIDFAWNTVILPIWDAIYNYVTTILVPTFQYLWDFLVLVWNGIMMVVDFAWNSIILPIWNAIYAFITGILVPIFQTLWDIAIRVWDGIWNAISTAWGIISGIFNALWSGIQWVIDKFWEIVGAVSNIIGQVVDWIGGLPGKIIGVLGNAATWLLQKGKDFISGLWDGMKSMWESVTGWLGGLAEGVANAIGDIGRKIVDIVKEAYNTAVDWYNEHIAAKVSIGPVDIPPKLPHLQFGGSALAGMPYIVGEVGPELFVPGASGNVIPNDVLVRLADAIVRFASDLGQVAGVLGFQRGGVVPGAGGPDTVPAMLTPGEVVLPPGEAPNLGQLWATQLTEAASTLGADVATGLGSLIEEAIPVLTDFGTQSTTLTADTMNQMLTTVTDTLTSMNAQTTDQYALMGATTTDNLTAMNADNASQYAQMNATTTANLDMMNAGVANQWTLMNQSTAGNMAILGQQVVNTMGNVMNTMNVGASTAAQSFVDQLNRRIPPLLTTLAQYSENVKNYGRQYLRDIGAPVTFAKGGVEDHSPQITNTLRVWGEPETGGEAYIPRFGSKMRAADILGVAAGWYGYGLVPFKRFQAGGLALEELFWENASGTDWDNGVNIGRTIGGHADHVHAGTTGAPWQALDAYLAQAGVPFDGGSTTSGAHASGSLHYLGRAKDYGTAANFGIPGVDRIYNAFLALVGGTPWSLPTPNVPPVPNFGPGIPAEQARIMAYYMNIAMNQKLNEARQAMIDQMMASAGGITGVHGGPYQDYAHSLMAAYGWGEADFQALVNLWNKESGWNPMARNPSSGAAGIPQDITGNFHGDGYGQIDWGLAYIAQRYGSPLAAWAHSQATGWYGRGGLNFLAAGDVLPSMTWLDVEDARRWMRQTPSGFLIDVDAAAAVEIARNAIGIGWSQAFATTDWARVMNIIDWDQAAGAPDHIPWDIYSQLGIDLAHMGLITDWSRIAAIIRWDLAAGAPDHIPGDLQNQLGVAAWVWGMQHGGLNVGQFDSGGVLMPGWNLMLNQLGSAEPLIPADTADLDLNSLYLRTQPEVADRLTRAVADALGTRSPTATPSGNEWNGLNVEELNISAMDPAAVARAIADEWQFQRLASGI